MNILKKTHTTVNLGEAVMVPIQTNSFYSLREYMSCPKCFKIILFTWVSECYCSDDMINISSLFNLNLSLFGA